MTQTLTINNVLARTIPLLALCMVLAASPGRILAAMFDNSPVCFIGHRGNRRKWVDSTANNLDKVTVAMAGGNGAAVRNAKTVNSTQVRRTTIQGHFSHLFAATNSMFTRIADAGQIFKTTYRRIIEPKGYCREQSKFV